jgi:hypothetical protein
MDFSQMFDAEDISICLNALYDSGVKDDTFALIYEANKTNVISVKTPNGLTETTTIHEKVMQGDVLSPLMSSNMVDFNIGKAAVVTGNIYMYKEKVAIPPLMMQDDTLGISVCGHKSQQMNNFLNTRTNIMNLQFGNDKCEKIHIGKHHNKDICPTLEVDSWKEVLEVNGLGRNKINDVYDGRKHMKEVSDKKYLGDIISHDGKNQKNIKDKTNKSMGNINKIVTTLTERPYGKYHFKAYRMMREGLLLAGLLTNAESWINMTKKDIEELEKPDLILMRNVLSVTGNPSKVFMMLELGIIPVRFVIMKKRMQFLHYILNESTESMIRKVYDTLKQDYRNGDFVSQTNSDRITLDINLDDSEIKSFSKGMWKNVIDKKIKSAAFEYLVGETYRKKILKIYYLRVWI